MEQNNVHVGMPDADGDFDGHPSQAHADHAAIMHAHGIISNPHRMAAVHALHQDGGGLINFLKKKQKDFSMKEPQQKAAMDNEPKSTVHEPMATDGEADMGKSFAGTEN